MTKDEALRLALEALKSTGENNGYHGVTQYFDETMVDQAITAIKAALSGEAQTRSVVKDEPVAWVNIDDLYDLEAGEDGDVPYVVRGNEQPKNMPKSIPLYTTTPPPRKPLTDEEIASIYMNHTDRPMHAQWDFARAIEAAHGIKGEA